MPSRFTAWYRSTLNRDGRVVWWEHVYAFVTAPLAVSLFAVRYYQTLWPMFVVLAITVPFSIWSWRQDLIVHNLDDPDSSNRVRDKSATVPWLTKFYAVACIVMFGVILYQWITKGHY